MAALLEKTGEVKIEFGYDYYVYIQGVNIDANTISSFQSEGIYIELLYLIRARNRRSIPLNYW